MPSSALPVIVLDLRAAALGSALASNAAAATPLPQVTLELHLGALQSKQGKRYDPAWQTSAPRFVGQLSAGGHHFYPRAAAHFLMERILVREGTPVTRRGRFTNEDGSLVYLADVSHVTYRLFEVTGSSAVELESEVLLAEDVLYASLQVTQGWRRDADGFLFEHLVPGDRLLEGGRVFRVEYVAELLDGTPRTDAFEIATSGLYTPSYELA